jgi:hypothetical protein
MRLIGQKEIVSFLVGPTVFYCKYLPDINWKYLTEIVKNRSKNKES